MKMINKSNYLDSHFKEDKKLYKSQSTLTTGLAGIDEYMSIRNGVYLLGGLPSVGKTTLAVQLADHFASVGKKVLFFSLEQTEYDLTVKSITRIKSKYHLNETDAIAEYKKFSDNITTVVAESSVTIEEIEATLDDYINSNGYKPIVFIDYLQFIQTNGGGPKREGITKVSNALVGMSKRHGLTMFVLSSLNRMNYISQIDFESFKESGSLEYDADVVFGLQYQLISDEKFIECSSVDKKRLMINDAKTQDVRKVELVCLKNRFGKIIPKCKLDYFANMETFVDSVDCDNKPNKKSGRKNVCSF